MASTNPPSRSRDTGATWPPGAAEGSLWPQYRHDGTLAGRSPLRGGLGRAPERIWSMDLGGQLAPREQWRVEDVNGDGHPEVLRILRDRLICQDLRGRKLWECRDLPKVQIAEISDFTGDGSRGVLVDVHTGSEEQTFMVSGVTGEKTLLYGRRNVFGNYRRSGGLLPEVSGQQICAWWSGDGARGAVCEGWLFSFEEGPAHPTVRFHVEEEGTIYAPLHLLADMDGDGCADMVMISHEQLWVYDLESSRRKLYAQWTPRTIRTYWALSAALPLKVGERPSLLMINPHLPGLKVVTQDGRTAREKWKVVVGPEEDQYQSQIKIEGGAPDPFIDLDGDGQIEIMAAITNEHGDGKTCLVIFGADRGERLFEAPDLSVLAAEDLDGDGRLEVFLRQSDGLLRLARWTENRFVDLWQGEDAEPLFQPPPPEQDLARAIGARSTLANPRVWRESPTATPFLMRLQGRVLRCQLEPEGSLRQLGQIVDHPALGPALPETHAWDGRTLKVLVEGQEVDRQVVPDQQVYLAPPALVGKLDGQLRVVVRDYQGSLLSLSPEGSDARVLVRHTPAFTEVPHSSEYPQICDVDGDGEPELLTSAMLAEDQPAVVAVDGRGDIKLRLDPPAGISQLSLGPSGSLGPGQGRWIAVRYIEPLSGPSVVAYDGRTGEVLWQREHFGSYGDRGTMFALHTPTAVCDYDRDGVDDFLAQSENFYNIVKGRTGEDLIDPMPVHSDAVPGHWTAYATPMLVDLLGDGAAKVLYSRSFSLTVVSDLQGTPFWHEGLTRDTTASSHAGLGDLDGDGRIEIVVSRPDGHLTAYQPEPVAHPCPTCPEETPDSDCGRGGQQRWTFQVPPPVSDITAVDLDGDGADELLLGAGDGRLYALKEIRGEATVLWSVAFDRPVGAPIVAGLDGDRGAAILVPTEDGNLHCLQAP